MSSVEVPKNLVYCVGCGTWQKVRHNALQWYCSKCGATISRDGRRASTPVNRELSVTEKRKRMEQAELIARVEANVRLPEDKARAKAERDRINAAKRREREKARKQLKMAVQRPDPIPILAGMLDDKWYDTSTLAGMIPPINGGVQMSVEMVRRSVRRSGLFDERRLPSRTVQFRSKAAYEVRERYKEVE